MGEMSTRPESTGEPYAEWAARLFDPAGRHVKPEALRGLRVLDLSVIIFGPATADFLGELGAEVIKVEMPGQGGPLTLAAPVWRMTRTPPRLKVPGRPAGFHTAHVYARHLGPGPAPLADLRAQGII
jgi:crotonobetainyl-CoA:carnitine CoA-transferase CaiB-like acyl-CoA transferase